MKKLEKYEIIDNVLEELGILIEYVPIPTRSEYEKSKNWPLSEQEKLDRRYLAALKIEKAYLMIYQVRENKECIGN